MFDLFFFLSLFSVGLLFLFFGYRLGGELWNKTFNRIGGVSNTGVVGEASVLAVLALIAVVADVFSRNCCGIGAKEILGQKSFWLTAASLTVAIVAYCLSLGPQEVLKKRSEKDKANSFCESDVKKLRLGYFVYSWYGVVACVGFGLVSAFLSTKLLSHDITFLKVAFNDLGSITQRISAQSGDVLVQCEVLSGEIFKGTGILRTATDRYLLLAALVCFLFLLIASTNIWKVYTEKALQFSKLAMWIVFLILVPVILSVSYTWYANYVGTAKEALETASGILAQNGTAEQFARLNELRKTNTEYLSMWGFVRFIFGGGGLLAVLFNAFIILFGSLLKKGDMAETFIPWKWLADIIKALLAKGEKQTKPENNSSRVTNKSKGL